MVKPKFYGMIGGKSTTIFSKNVNNVLDDKQIVKNWDTLTDLHKEINKSGPEAIKGISAILILDKCFQEDEKLENMVGKFDFVQRLFKDKELYGTHLIVYTPDERFYTALKEYYDEDEDLKYEGTRIVFCDTDYTVQSLARILDRPYELLSYDAKLEKDLELQELRRNKKLEEMNAKRYFMSMVGKKEMLEQLIDTMNRELSVLNKQIYEYAIALESNDLTRIENVSNMVDREIEEQLDRLN